jgi:energy-coupling factor transport system permease protein
VKTSDFDPRTQLGLGLMAIAAVLIADRPQTVLGEGIVVACLLVVLGVGTGIAGFLGLSLPMVGLVFIVSWISFDFIQAGLLSLRLFNLFTVSSIFFSVIGADELAAALRKMKLPFGLVFILSTAMRYVPLIGQKARDIVAAQQSRGIDLRPKIKNIRNLMALMIPLLVQSFRLADDLALAMESRGFTLKNRTFRRAYQLRAKDWAVMAGAFACLVGFVFWERG